MTVSEEHPHDGEINAFQTDNRGLVIHCVGNEDAWIKTQRPVDLAERE